MQNLVSVIIPTYNRAHSVAEAIRSAKAQNYPAVQIIIIDDGSQDNTAEIVKQFNGVEYFYQENRGQAAARNLGLKYSKGDYIASLDSDDMWHPEFLTEGVRCIEKHDLDFVFFNWIGLDGKETFINFWQRSKRWKDYISENDAEWLLLDPQQLRNLYLEVCPSPSSSLLLRRSSLVSSWNEKMIAADDWYFMLNLVLLKPCRAAFTLTPYWTKRVFGDNVYDGRNLIELTFNGIHDDRIMEEDFGEQMTKLEKSIFQKRLAITRLNFGRLKWKSESISKHLLLDVYKTFMMAPITVSHQMFEIFKNHIKHRIDTISPDNNSEDKQ